MMADEHRVPMIQIYLRLALNCKTVFQAFLGVSVRQGQALICFLSMAAVHLHMELKTLVENKVFLK